MRTIIDPRLPVAVVSREKSAAAPALRQMLGVPVDVWDPYDLAMGRGGEKAYQAVVVENFQPRRQSGTLEECTAVRWSMARAPLTVVSLDDPSGRRLAEGLGRTAFAYSDGRDRADLTARNVNLRWGRLEFEALTCRDIVRVRLPMGETPDLYGPLAALACAVGLGLPLEEAAARLRRALTGARAEY